jgi:GNAT superfamily N-acetyltransferase
MRQMQDITFRTAGRDDIPLIRDLSSRIWREHYPGIISREQIDYMLGKMYAPDVIADEMEDRGYRYVIVAAGPVPVGYIAYRCDVEARLVLLSKLYLLPELHRRGIGGRMLRYVKDEALRAGARSIHLFVNKKNRQAIRAYELFGMVKTEELVTDIGGGFVMDDYRMELDLRERN